MITVVKQYLIVPEEVSTTEMKRFLQILKERKCRYYVSDIYGNSNKQELDALDGRVQKTLEVFQTLQIPVDAHFQLVLRGTPQHQVYKDWKISELACVYMLINGASADLPSIADQQHRIINELLNYLHKPILEIPVQDTE